MSNFSGTGNLENGDLIDGGAGSDSLTGGSADDTIIGGQARDTINAGAGDDVVYDDNIDFSTGSIASEDVVDLGAGDDVFIGTGRGAADRDLVLGGEGNDTISVRQSFDTVYGGDGDDYITSEGEVAAYGDILSGDAGDDTIIGANTHDTIHGGTGNDSLFGEDGNDFIEGGRGSDIIDGGDGNDSIFADAAGSGRVIEIINHSFEDQVLGDNSSNSTITGWDEVGGTQTYNPAASWHLNGGIDGQNIAFLSGTGGPQSISQTLAETYVAGNTYEFTVALGDRVGTAAAPF